MKIKHKKKRISSVALISFTDIIFLLLIFILISSSFITHSGIKINLPSSTVQQNDYTKNISLTLTKDEEIYLDDELVTWETLPKLLNERMLNDPEQVVVVRADQDIPLRKVVRLLDKARESGSNRFFIATEITAREE
jgi:biopolymer transport protein ExbD